MQNKISTWMMQELEYKSLNATFYHSVIFFPQINLMGNSSTERERSKFSHLHLTDNGANHYPL